MPRTQSGHQGHTGQHHTLIVLASLPKMTLSPGKNSMYTPSSNRGMLHCPSTVQPSFCEKTFVRTACQKHGKQGKSYTLVWTTGLVPFLAQPATVTQNLPYIYIVYISAIRWDQTDQNFSSSSYFQCPVAVAVDQENHMLRDNN